MTPEQANPQITTARVRYAHAKQHENELRRQCKAAKAGPGDVYWALYFQLGDAHRATARARRAWTNPRLRI